MFQLPNHCFPGSTLNRLAKTFLKVSFPWKNCFHNPVLTNCYHIEKSIRYVFLLWNCPFKRGVFLRATCFSLISSSFIVIMTHLIDILVCIWSFTYMKNTFPPYFSGSFCFAKNTFSHLFLFPSLLGYHGH